LRVFLKMMTTAIREREKEEVRIISASSIKQQERWLSFQRAWAR
jgi:uncharacterized DUF497 family protein